MQKITLLLLTVLLSLTPQAFAQQEACFAVGGDWDTQQQRCVLKNALDIQITYPMELADAPFAQAAVNEFFNTRRAEFLRWFVDGLDFYTPVPWSLYIDYEIYTHAENIFTYKFDVSDYTGGAHPNLYFHTLTFDLENQTVLSLDELFTDTEAALALISPFVQADLAFQQGDFADSQWIAEGTGENPDNYQVFAVGEDALFFFFPPYQVAPYAAGPFTVEIPLSALSGVLSDQLQ